jgi:uncharacterized iron-regulated protein
MLRRLSAVIALLVAACAPRYHSKLKPASAQRLVEEPISSSRTWITEEDAALPLVGRIWDVRAGRFVDDAALMAAAAGADLLLLGETHDNPDHHVLQARIVRQVTAAGRRPALAFEMLPTTQQETVDAALARAPRDPDVLGAALRWDESGWPDFVMYRPIFAAGLDAGLPIVAANLPRAVVKDLVTKGAGALDAPLRERLEREEPLAPEALASLREEMRESHCNELPDAMLEPLVLAQRAKDARMSRRMVEAGAGGRGAILVTGKGHARTDRGVPSYLAKDAPGQKVFSVGFFEADPDKPEPAAYAQDYGTSQPPFDALVFTPGAEREDPCAGLREKMMKKRKAGATK